MSTRSTDQISDELMCNTDLNGGSVGEGDETLAQFEVEYDADDGRRAAYCELNRAQTEKLVSLLQKRLDDSDQWDEASHYTQPEPISTPRLALLEADIDVLIGKLERHYGRPFRYRGWK